MRKTAFVFLAGLLAWTCAAEPVCVDGMCYPDEAAARAAGVSEAKIAAARASGAHDDAPVQGLSDLKNLLHATDAPSVRESGEKSAAEGRMRRRLAFGYMDAATFTAFLSGTPTAADMLGNASVAMVFLLVLLGGLVMNLTPCVLPLVPVSLVLVGRGGARGAAYGLGMTLAYGALGLAAAFGGLAFGAIQASPWFNLVVAVVFLVLGLATSEVFFIDFSRFRPRPAAGGGVVPQRGLLGPFFLGTGTAVLAGACVAPILLATLVLTAKWFAEGRVWAVALPFVLGAGMGLPWPFITAGMSVLPKPGMWMRWVNRVFAVVLFGFAVWYGWLAWGGFTARAEAAPAPAQENAAAEDASLPTLVIVGAPWCKNCTAMEKTTLKEPSVVEALAKFNVKHVEINTFADLANYPELAGLDIKGVPAYVVIEKEKEVRAP
ncbi:MAG: thioredoxin family protein [Kiritimatiellae bacterium]|nr:thioredoxin family protein [Kiritimatiellia bacterium]